MIPSLQAGVVSLSRLGNAAGVGVLSRPAAANTPARRATPSRVRGCCWLNSGRTGGDAGSVTTTLRHVCLPTSVVNERGPATNSWGVAKSGKAAGFDPVIAGSNPAAPTNSEHGFRAVRTAAAWKADTRWSAGDLKHDLKGDRKPARPPATGDGKAELGTPERKLPSQCGGWPAVHSFARKAHHSFCPTAGERAFGPCVSLDVKPPCQLAGVPSGAPASFFGGEA